MNRPLAALNIRTAVPEQSWLLPNGHEVLVDRADRAPGAARAGHRGGGSGCGAAVAGPGWTASAPTWSRPWRTSCAPR